MFPLGKLVGERKSLAPRAAATALEFLPRPHGLVVKCGGRPNCLIIHSF